MKFLILYLITIFLICIVFYIGKWIFTVWRNTKRERVLRLYRQAELIAWYRAEEDGK